MSDEQKPTPKTVPERRAAAVRTALVLGGIALAVYVYAMFKTVSGGGA